jgi:Acyltransferase C-terminus
MYFTLRSTYLQGRPPKSVNMHWRRFAVSDIPLDDQKEFDTWLRVRWAEKDDLLEQFYNSGRFPSDLVETGSANGAPSGGRGSTTPVGYIETDIGLRHWIEIGEIFGITPLLHLL